MPERAASDPMEHLRELVTEWERGFDSLASRVMGTDEFCRAMNQFQNAQLGMQKAFAELMGKHLANLNLPAGTACCAWAGRARGGHALARMEQHLEEVARAAGAADPLPPKGRRARASRRALHVGGKIPGPDGSLGAHRRALIQDTLHPEDTKVMNTRVTVPVKRREMHNHHVDSTIWNDLEFRDDDIVIATYAKSGTTWMQQIVAQLLFEGDPDVETAELSPWLDLRVPPKEVKLPQVEAQTHRRFLKTHLPVDALVFSPRARYIYIGRDGRDVIWSFYNHHVNANALWYEALNDTPGRVGPPIGPPPADIREYFRAWLDQDGYPWWPFWENVRSWWEVRHLPNVLMVHFDSLKRDMPAGIRRIAAFLGISINESCWDAIVEHCSFDWMKQNAARTVPLGGAFWDGGAQVFIHQGVNGRWRDVLTPEEIDAYDQRAVDELGEDCARWLAAGES